ncbi:MAG: SGNH/GDSL hydrolase family protein [Chitinophagaceae bacterium]
MKPAIIKTTFIYLCLQACLLCAGILLSASCKKNASPTNDNSMTTVNNNKPDTTVKKYLALGDSYTIGTSVNEADRYPVQTAAILQQEGINVRTSIIATNGWTTGDLMNAIKNTTLTNDYDVVTLLIGVNNQYQGRTLDEYKEQFTWLLEKSIELAKGKPSHVIVLSIPDYSVTPFAKGRDVQQIAKEIDAFNAANKSIADTYGAGYLYITDESRKAASDLSLVAADNLHFSGKEYALWSYKLAPMIRPSMQ